MLARSTRRPSVWRAASSRKYYGRQLVAALPLSSQDVHRRQANQAPGPTLRPAEVGQSHLVYIAGLLSSAHPVRMRSEEHTSELQSQSNLVCRLLLEKKKEQPRKTVVDTTPQITIASI